MENPMNWTYRASELIQTSVAPSSLRWAMGVGRLDLKNYGSYWRAQVESWANILVLLSGDESKRPLLAALSHLFLSWVGSVRALWKNMRMNSLNSFPERLTMLKTNFVVSEQVRCFHFTLCPHSHVEIGTFRSALPPVSPLILAQSWLPLPMA